MSGATLFHPHKAHVVHWVCASTSHCWVSWITSGTGTIDQELDTYYGLPIVKTSGELDLSQRTVMERDAADPYQDCESQKLVRPDWLLWAHGF